MSPKEISTKMIQLCINTSSLDAVTPEEEALGYFPKKKLQRLSMRDKWKAGKTKQIDQFHFQGMFGKPKYPNVLNGIPKGLIILRPHWQYTVKQSGV